MAAMSASRSRPPLPCPGVHLDAALVLRAERFAARLTAARGRREGASRAGSAGAGFEFDHYRPYRPGDELRQLDWDVYARSAQAVVRVVRPEAGERWAILLDTSASMGVGPPGKLQRAAECALALALLGLRQDATSELVDLVRGERFVLTRRTQSGALVRWLAARRAEGPLARRAWSEGSASAVRAERAFLLSDCADAALLGGSRASARGTRWSWLAILAPLELDPGELDAVRWLDPEGAEELALEVDAGVRASYARALERSRAELARAAAAQGIALARASSAEDFELALARLVGT